MNSPVLMSVLNNQMAEEYKIYDEKIMKMKQAAVDYLSESNDLFDFSIQSYQLKLNDKIIEWSVMHAFGDKQDKNFYIEEANKLINELNLMMSE